MSVSIVPCPECHTLLLSDTAQCPTCHHVFDPDRVTDLHDVAGIPQASDEVPCPDCGEMCRPELVRCFNCGGFLRREIAKRYEEMQQGAYGEPGEQQIVVSTGHDGDAAGTGGEDDFSLSPGTTATEDDFELAPGVSVDDDDFELSPEIAAASTPPPPSRAPAPSAAASPAAADEEIELVTDGPAKAPSSPPQAAARAVDDDLDIPAASPAAAAPGTAASDEDLAAELLGAAGATDQGADAPRPPAATDGTPAPPNATADALLDIAIAEQEESAQRAEDRKRQKPKLKVRTGFIVFCPNGHQVEVQEKHRGKTGKCPKCKSPFFVPEAHWEKKGEGEQAAGETPAEGSEAVPAGETPAAASATGYRWIADVHVHTVDPTKLKLKPGSLEGSFETFDFGFDKEQGLLSVSLVKGGMFGSADKKKAEAREAMLGHLAEGKPVEELPVAGRKSFGVEALSEIKVVQPAARADESMFAGIAVFGEQHVAVRLPRAGDSDPLTFASFNLSGFRTFAGILEELYGIGGLADGLHVPVDDEFEDVLCHYTDQKLRALKHIEWYQKDGSFELQLIGRRCQNCGLNISEDARKKENIGGANGKGIAKAKCPKCQSKFGEISLFTLGEAVPKGAETVAEEVTA